MNANLKLLLPVLFYSWSSAGVGGYIFHIIKCSFERHQGVLPTEHHKNLIMINILREMNPNEFYPENLNIFKKEYGVGGPGGNVLSEISEGKDKYQNISLYLWNLKTNYEQKIATTTTKISLI